MTEKVTENMFSTPACLLKLSSIRTWLYIDWRTPETLWFNLHGFKSQSYWEAKDHVICIKLLIGNWLYHNRGFHWFEKSKGVQPKPAVTKKSITIQRWIFCWHFFCFSTSPLKLVENVSSMCLPLFLGFLSTPPNICSDSFNIVLSPYLAAAAAAAAGYRLAMVARTKLRCFRTGSQGIDTINFLT